MKCPFQDRKVSDLASVCQVDLFIFVPIVFPVDFLIVVNVLSLVVFFILCSVRHSQNYAMYDTLSILFNIVVLKNQVVTHLLRNLDRLMYCRPH